MNGALEPKPVPFLGMHSHALQLKVVLVYENFEMGVQGKNVFDVIAKAVEGEHAAQLTVWRFDFFHSAELTAAVSRQAEEADVIIVAPRDPNYLPPHVKAWLEHWPRHRKLASGVVVALFHPDAAVTARSSDTALLLWRAACRAQMDFICRKSESGTFGDIRGVHPPAMRAATSGSFMGFSPIATTGWGLND